MVTSPTKPRVKPSLSEILHISVKASRQADTRPSIFLAVQELVYKGRYTIDAKSIPRSRINATYKNDVCPISPISYATGMVRAVARRAWANLPIFIRLREL